MSESYTGSNAGPIVVTFTLPTDGDDVDVVTVNTFFQPDADNWQYALRVYPNMLTGFDQRANWRGNVQFGNTWYLDRSWNNGTEAVVQIYGPTGGGSASLDVFAGGGNGNAIRGSGQGTGAGVYGIGGATGSGLVGDGGATSGAGVTGRGNGGNASGGAFTGNGSGAGVVAAGGSSNGPGLVASSAGSGDGVRASSGSGNAISCQGKQTITGALVHSGAGAVNQLRETLVTSIGVTAGGTGGHLVLDADNTFDPSQTDVVFMGTAPTLTADRTWTLSHPSGPCIVFFKVIGGGGGGGHAIGLFDASGGSAIAVFSAGTWADVPLYYSPAAGSWLVYG